MKKIIVFALLALLWASQVHAENWELLARKWDGVSVAAGADEFASPIQISDVGTFGTHLWRFEIMCPTSTVVRIEVVYQSQTKVLNFNAGLPISADTGYSFTRVLPAGATVDPEHVTGTQNCAWDIYFKKG